MFRTFVIAFCGIALMCSSCRHHSKLLGSKRQVTTAFYHWKTTVALSHEDSTMLRKTGCKKLYVNFFDVVPYWDTAKFKYPAVPGAHTEDLTDLPKGMEIIPVIYVTNEAILNMDSVEIPLMAEKICRKLSRFVKWGGIDSIRELQMDCDWTHSSRDKYFYLLKEIKRISQVPTLSATIRLYQYKYFKKAGVPPVDKGVLMFYHMNAVRDYDSKELILDVEEGKKYMTSAVYPLHLDYALPLFSEMLVPTYRWEMGYTSVRGANFFSPKTLDKLLSAHSLEKIDTSMNEYRVTRPIYFDEEGINLYQGSTVKLEITDKEQLKKAADLLSKYANSDTFNVIFFHLDRNANSTFTPNEVKDIISRFD